MSNNTYKLLSEKSIKTILRNHYQKSHCKRCIETIIREIMPNNSCKLLPEKLLQTIFINYYLKIVSNNTYKLLPANHFKRNYSQRNISKNTHKLFIKENIPNNTYKSLQEKSFQTIFTNYYQINHWKKYL